MLATQTNAGASPPVLVRAGEIFLVGAHGEHDHLARHVEEIGVEAAEQRHRPFGQPGILDHQPLVGDQRQAGVCARPSPRPRGSAARARPGRRSRGRRAVSRHNRAAPPMVIGARDGGSGGRPSSRPLAMPSISTGTISSPSRATMPCSGRTQRRACAELAPAHRLGPGEVARRSAAMASAEHLAPSRRPACSITAKQTPSRSSSWSRVSPVLRRKPSSACGGALVRGPLISSLTRFGRRRPVRARSAPAAAASNTVSIAPGRQPRLVQSPRRTAARDRCAPSPASAPGFPRDSSSSRKSAHHAAYPFASIHAAQARLREVADAADIGLALGDRDHAARLQRVEHVAGLDRLLIGGDRELRVEAVLALRRRLA